MPSTDLTDLLQIATRLFAIVAMLNYIRLKYEVRLVMDWLLLFYVALYAYGVFYVSIRFFDLPLHDYKFFQDLIVPTQIVAAPVLGLWFLNGEFNRWVARTTRKWSSMIKQFRGFLQF